MQDCQRDDADNLSNGNSGSGGGLTADYLAPHERLSGSSGNLSSAPAYGTLDGGSHNSSNATAISLAQNLASWRLKRRHSRQCRGQHYDECILYQFVRSSSAFALVLRGCGTVDEFASTSTSTGSIFDLQ